MNLKLLAISLKVITILIFLESVKAENSETVQLDNQFRKIMGPNGEPLKHFDYPPYYKNLEASKFPPKGESLNLFNTEIFQSVNPFFVVILTPLVIAFFAFKRRRNNEPTTGRGHRLMARS